MAKYKIRCSQVVSYFKEVELTKEEFDQLHSLLDDDVMESRNPKEYHMIRDLIETNDPFDVMNEFTGFEIYPA